MDSARLAGSIELEIQPNSRAWNLSTNRSQEGLSEQARQSGHDGGIEQQLAPADGGAAAWKVLCAAFTFEAVLWGEREVICAYGRRY